MTIHLFVSPKGGSGLSLSASYFTQYLLNTNNKVACFDASYATQTLKTYSGLPVECFKIDYEVGNYSKEFFEALCERVARVEGHAVVDTSTGMFVPFLRFLEQLNNDKTVSVYGRKVVFHTVITGGHGLHTTSLGLNELLLKFDNPIVVWENEFFGKVEQNGKRFRDSTMFLPNLDRFLAVIKLRRGYCDTTDKDMDLLLNNFLTFDQARTSGLFNLIQKARIERESEAVFAQFSPHLFE